MIAVMNLNPIIDEPESDAKIYLARLRALFPEQLVVLALGHGYIVILHAEHEVPPAGALRLHFDDAVGFAKAMVRRVLDERL